MKKVFSKTSIAGRWHLDRVFFSVKTADFSKHFHLQKNTSNFSRFESPVCSNLELLVCSSKSSSSSKNDEFILKLFITSPVPTPNVPAATIDVFQERFV